MLELFGIPLSGKLAWLAWAGAYLIKMVGIRKQIEVGLDHLTHLVFEHDTSQIMNRRQILSDEELNLSLGLGEPGVEGATPAGPLGAGEAGPDGIAAADARPAAAGEGR